MMHYIRVRWIHSHKDEPVEIFSELDEARFERRKVEIYANSEASFASEDKQIGTSQLSIEPIPTVEEINLDSQFNAASIDQEEFEKIWSRFVI